MVCRSRLKGAKDMKHTRSNIILAVKFSSGMESFQAAADRLKQNRLSKDSRFSAFMPCLHWLANDKRGFFIPGRDEVTISLPGMLCSLLGGVANEQRGAMFQSVATGGKENTISLNKLSEPCNR